MTKHQDNEHPALISQVIANQKQSMIIAYGRFEQLCSNLKMPEN
jgi:hypothetical protein